MSKPIFKRSDIANAEYYREHRTAILEAMREPGRPRLVDDVYSREAINVRNQAATTITKKEVESAPNLYQPEEPMRFTRSAIAAMSPQEYAKNRKAILEAAKLKDGIIDDTERPQFKQSITLYENENAYIQSGGHALQRARDKAAIAA